MYSKSKTSTNTGLVVNVDARFLSGSKSLKHTYLCSESLVLQGCCFYDLALTIMILITIVPFVDKNNIVDVAIAAGNFKTLVQLLTDLDLVDTLRNKAAQTIFAPSDEAFERVSLHHLNHTGKLKATVLRHVLDGITVPAIDVFTGDFLTLGGENINLIKSLGGEKITLPKSVGDVQISYMKNYINVVKADVMADNGVIHVIDKVIMPPSKFPT